MGEYESKGIYPDRFLDVLKFDDSFIYRKIPLSQIAGAFELFKVPGTVKGKILIDSEN